MSDDTKNNKQFSRILKGGDNSFCGPSDDPMHFAPLEVMVYNNFEKAFKAFKSMVQKERNISLYKEKQQYEKPSEKKRRKRNEMKKKLLELEVKTQKILSGEFDKEKEKKQAQKEKRMKERSEKQSEFE